MCQVAVATPIEVSPGVIFNEITNGTFSDGLNGWEYVPGEVIPSVVGNPAPAAQCNRSLEGWGDRMRQVVDDTLNPLWNPNYHIKMIDLQADIAVLVKDGATGGVRFRLDYWDESYNSWNVAPTTTDPAQGYHVTDWKEYTSNQEFWFTTKNPFDRIILPIQPRWISVEIEFLQPSGAINLVDNVILTSKCIPEPGAMASLVAGLMGLVGVTRFRRK
jgi:hypothetical protein